jgi:hypothetical protein
MNTKSRKGARAPDVIILREKDLTMANVSFESHEPLAPNLNSPVKEAKDEARI